MPDTHRSSSGGFSSGVSDVAAAAVDERRPAKEEEPSITEQKRLINVNVFRACLGDVSLDSRHQSASARKMTIQDVGTLEGRQML
eukprot:5567859-Amphidinium_carterae.1